MAELDGPGLAVSAGTVSLNSAQVATDVNLAGARLGGHPKTAFSADGAVIGTRLILTGMQAAGEVSMRTAHVGTRLLLQRAHIENPGGTALRLSGVEVASDVFGDDLTVYGMIRAQGARIGGINLAGARLFNPGSVALDAEAMQVTRGISLLRPSPFRAVSASATLAPESCATIRAPGRMTCGSAGLSYAALEPQLPARSRLNWLARDPDGYSLQPYQQLATLYTDIGQPGQARQVLYAAERRQRAVMSVPGRAWSLLQDVTVGYGYRPARAAVGWQPSCSSVASSTALLLRHLSPAPRHRTLIRSSTPWIFFCPS